MKLWNNAHFAAYVFGSISVDKGISRFLSMLVGWGDVGYHHSIAISRECL